MVIKYLLWLSTLALALSMSENAVSAPAAGKTFPTLTIGFTTYTNATITDVAGGSVFLRHLRGFESLRIDSLDPKVLSELGIQAPTPRPARRRGSSGSGAAPPGQMVETPRIENEVAAGPWKRLGKPSVPEGLGGTIVIGFSVAGFFLFFAGWIMFVVSAFSVGPWWGLGVLFGGVTCGIVPLIFFFSHLDACRKAFFFSVGGFVLMVVSGAVGAALEHSQAAAKARQKAMISYHQAWV